ncbi:unnamed protein product [Auanema sp. JU1783]|nr:unnamed protein product [Auanema sp. JU1783]
MSSVSSATTVGTVQEEYKIPPRALERKAFKMTFGLGKVTYQVHSELGHLHWMAENVARDSRRMVQGVPLQEEEHLLGQMSDLQDACYKAAKVHEQEDIGDDLAAWGLPTNAEDLRDMVVHPG